MESDFYIKLIEEYLDFTGLRSGEYKIVLDYDRVNFYNHDGELILVLGISDTEKIVKTKFKSENYDKIFDLIDELRAKVYEIYLHKFIKDNKLETLMKDIFVSDFTLLNRVIVKNIRNKVYLVSDFDLKVLVEITDLYDNIDIKFIEPKTLLESQIIDIISNNKNYIKSVYLYARRFKC